MVLLFLTQRVAYFSPNVSEEHAELFAKTKFSYPEDGGSSLFLNVGKHSEQRKKAKDHRLSGIDW